MVNLSTQLTKSKKLREECQIKVSQDITSDSILEKAHVAKPCHLQQQQLKREEGEEEEEEEEGGGGVLTSI